MATVSLNALIALVLAWNYFAYQAELFDSEYEANHPARATAAAITAPVLSWESFDKDQAPAPYIFDAWARLEVVSLLLPAGAAHTLPCRQTDPVRDKSPPPA